MPLYDYKCRSCQKVTEVRHGFKESFEGSCPECGGEMARVFSPAGIVFKGSGFYLTDSRKAAESKKSPSSDSKSEGSGSESKSDAPSSTPAAPAASTAAAPASSSKSETAA